MNDSNLLVTIQIHLLTHSMEKSEVLENPVIISSAHTRRVVLKWVLVLRDFALGSLLVNFDGHLFSYDKGNTIYYWVGTI